MSSPTRLKFLKYLRWSIDALSIFSALLLIFFVDVIHLNAFGIPDSPSFATEAIRGLTSLVAISAASTTFLIGFFMKGQKGIKNIPFRVGCYFLGILLSVIFAYDSYKLLIFGDIIMALNEMFLSVLISWLVFFNVFYFFYLTED